METVHKRRLGKLASFLENLPRKKFNFTVYAQEASCGTVACAIGWMPDVFPSKGFKRVKIVGTDQMYVRDREDRKGFGMAADFFGISSNQADRLFSFDLDRDLPFAGVRCEPDATPKRVAKRIRNFVAGVR